MNHIAKTSILLAACLAANGAWGDESSAGHTPGTPPPPQSTQPPAGIYRHPGTVFTPPVSAPAAAGVVHTNYKIFIPQGGQLANVSPNYSFDGETPASMACVYDVGPVYTGCVPFTNSDHAVGGWGAIALVDAYNYVAAADDIKVFDEEWGLPAAKFKRIIANSSYGTLNGLTASCSGTPVNANRYGWDLEEALDIEWSHAMAPSAEILLVEACTSSLNDLLYAEEVAGAEVEAYGGGDISNSWGADEFSGEESYDNYFYRYYPWNITYFAAAGDSGSEGIYPSSSPWVVSAGGTTVNRDSSGNFLSESCWSDSGGGPSTIEQWANPPGIESGLGPWTNSQYILFGGVPFAQPFRSTPDISFNADPNTGVWVYDSDYAGGGGWFIVGGTSVSSPSLAGIVNNAGNKLGQSPADGGWYSTYELNLLYAQLNTVKAYETNFYDVTSGSNGYAAGTGYDQCTGIGSPRGKLGK